MSEDKKHNKYMGLTPEQLAQVYSAPLVDVMAAIQAGKLTPLMDGSYPAKFKALGLTQAELARLRNVSREAVSKAARNGWLVQFFDGSYDAEASMARWNERAGARPDSARGEGVGGSAQNGEGEGENNSSYDSARARVEEAKAEMLELRLAQLKGETVRVADVEAAWFNVLRLVRDDLRNIPDGLAGRLTGKGDVREVREILAAAIDKALEVTSNKLTYGAPDEDEEDEEGEVGATEAQENDAQ